MREQIMLDALEDSKARAVVNTAIVPPGHAFRDPKHWLYTHPQNPFHPDHVNAAGERVRNGYPTSAWTWVTVSREWWAVLRARLWERVVLRGAAAYKGFMRLLEDPDSCFIREFVRMVVLGELPDEPHQMYEVLRALPAVERIAYKPWPPQHHFDQPFGVHVIPTTPGPKALIVPEVPFDRVTSVSTREHLRALPRLERLELKLDTLSAELGQLFASLPHLRHLRLTLPSVHPAQLIPFAIPETARIIHAASEGTTDELLIQDGRTRLDSFDISASIVHDDVLPELRAFLAADPRLGPVTTIFRGTGTAREVAYAPAERAALALELVELAHEVARGTRRGTDSVNVTNGADPNGAERTTGSNFTRGSLLHMSDAGGKEHWQRSTSLRLLGGLINLRMESRK
jgi:hypothetical protein